MSPRIDRWRTILTHVVRCAVFASILGVIHLQQRQYDSAAQSSDSKQIELHQAQPLFPTAHSVGPTQLPEAWQEVADIESRLLGYVAQTSPAADRVIGYCGPTNVLIALDPNRSIAGIQVLDSADTRHHVAKVRTDESFLRSFVGIDPAQANDMGVVDAVSGATLTSLAIQESIALRFGGTKRALRFPKEIEIAAVERIFSSVKSLAPDDLHESLFHVLDGKAQRVGWLLRTTPAADGIMGYQGPTDALVGFDLEGRTLGMVVGDSYDNEPYVTYVREDTYFAHLLDTRLLAELAVLDLEAAGVEGVSGATMTSVAVAEGIVKVAEDLERARQAERDRPSWYRGVAIRSPMTATVVVLAMVVGLTRLRGKRWARVGLNVLVVAYLGLISGELLSLSLIGGWAQHGISWRHGLGFVVLATAAFLVPLTNGANLYCNHICPHGVAQQWIYRVSPWRYRLPRRLVSVLSLVPLGLLAVAVVLAMCPGPIELVDLEAFDAWHWAIAGSAAITIAIVGLVASAYSPMAYCRFGCPTGALLKALRLNALSGVWTRRDWAAVGLLGLALILLGNARP